MNKTWKRQVFRHTALYTAILMFSHTGGGGQAQAQTQTHKYAIVLNAQKLPEVKWGSSYTSLGHKDKDLQFTHTSNFGIKKNIILSFNNTDEVVAEKKDAVVFGAATYLPPYGKVSGFDDKRLTERKNAVDWIGTTKPGLVGYSYEDVTCNSSNCPEVSYKTQFTFDKHQLAKKKTDNKLDIYEDKSRDNSPIYKLPDYPGLGVSFNLSGESTVKPKRLSQLVSSFSEDVTQQNGANSPYKDKNLVYTTDDYRNQGNHNHQDKHHAIIFYLNAKLHLLDKKQIKNIAQGKTFNLGTLKPRIDLTEAWKNRNGGFFNNGNWTFEDKGEVSVKLSLPQVKAGRCINKDNPNPKSKAPSPALTAPALWFGPVQNGKVQMYSASVSTYPDSSSSQIFLQNLSRKDDTSKPGRYSLKPLSTSEIKSKEPTFTGRQTVIRLDGGVHEIKLDRSNEATGLNGNDGKNDTFGIVSEGSFMPDDSEWKKVLLPWTVRGFADDSKFKEFNKEEKNNDNKPKYSQKYRSRDSSKHERNLGDIVNSPIVAVGGYLATSANDGMVHIFKKGNGGDERNYSLKLSYIPGTMPRKDIENKDSTLAKELRAFAEKGYVGDRYGVDGGFVLRQVNNLNGQDRVFMFGAMGFGGRGAYALDLTKAENGNPTAVSLFDVKNDDKNNNGVKLGYTVGTPQIGKTHDGKYAAFLASGYATKDINSTENQTALYVYDLENNNGTPIAKIEVTGGKGGLSSPTLVDKDLDGTVDIAYAGDRGGSMYRFDLSGNDPTKWSARTIFQGTKPITSAPAISQLKDKRVVIFGTGSDLSEDDVLSTSEQYIYGIFDDDTVANNVNVKLSSLGGGLLEQKLSEENKTLFLTDYKRSDGSGDKGWVVKLEAGQRVTVKPTVVLRTAFVTIHKYTGNDKCGAETAILGINTADGGKLTKKSARPIVPDANKDVAQYSGHKKGTNGKSIPIGCMEKNGGTVCPNGYVYDKPVNVRYLDEKKTDGFSTTADGDAGGSGIDPAGKRAGKNNRCFSQKGVRTLLMNDLDSLDITGPTCGMKRISWREVFF
ncbi:PilC family type IV pilus tip adhesin [Neisseria meningitidis]|uniref:PilC family type IV pilus tip adhesin n=1 Tax=Neisseria meningitidis TaxID=487 RepID=UPI00076673DF|nr:PilC family type IV pilus tip adhesin [Neisseria meningitidis]CWP89004.1 type IV pilus assembly protein PilC [Neisseria meningitidis]CWT29749.1 type IV pilus assembly protein PilC [Neisseria meningitidis]